MNVNIIVPYRPLSKGGLSTPMVEQHQLPDGRWNGWGDELSEDNSEVRNINTTIKFLNKNSVYKHKIIVAIDSDIYPNKDFLKEFDNVTILKSPYICKESVCPPYWRLNAAYKHVIDSIPDEEWLCHGYTADLICAKNWDEPIINAILQNGDNYVYVPMFIEAWEAYGNIRLKGLEPTAERIWDDWRKNVSCHALTFPEPEKGFITEKDLDSYIEKANERKMGLIKEDCGKREYGYYNVMFMKAKYAKIAMRLIGHGFDIDFDDRLRDVLHITKIVVTNSFILHPVRTPFRES